MKISEKTYFTILKGFVIFLIIFAAAGAGLWIYTNSSLYNNPPLYSDYTDENTSTFLKQYPQQIVCYADTKENKVFFVYPEVQPSQMEIPKTMDQSGYFTFTYWSASWSKNFLKLWPPGILLGIASLIMSVLSSTCWGLRNKNE